MNEIIFDFIGERNIIIFSVELFQLFFQNIKININIIIDITIV